MRFLFESVEATDRASLLQGDVLLRTPAMAEMLRLAHAHYAEAADYTHFMVLTQSCDLVQRRGRMKSPYITLAAVRPLSILTSRVFAPYKVELDFPYSVLQKEREISVVQLLERLLHNTQDEYFFFRGGEHPALPDDSCVFLRLSVALRAEHYAVCLGAKVAQLTNIFQAKVGWLTGNIYSRVGTPDIEEKVSNPEEYKSEFYDEVAYNRAVWLTPEQTRALKNSIVEWRRQHPGQVMTDEVADQLIEALPNDLELIADRAVKQLAQAQLMPADRETAARAKSLLSNDEGLRKLLSRLTSTAATES